LRGIDLKESITESTGKGGADCVPEGFLSRIKSLHPRNIIWASLLASEILTICLGLVLSIIFYQTVERDLLLTGVLNGLLVSVIISFVFVQYLLKKQKKSEEALHSSARFLGTIFDSIRDPFSIVDRDFRIVRVNEAYSALRNIASKESLYGQKCYNVLAQSSTVCPDCIIEKTFLTANPCAKEKARELPDGSLIWVEIFTYPIFDREGKVSHVIEYVRDITGRKKSEEDKKKLIDKLERLSRTDSLTGLLNKRALLDRLEYEAERARRYRTPLALLICDLDHFKEINDTYGHSTGDKVLQVFADILTSSVRRPDIVGRFGGDEFMVIFPQTQARGAEDFAERLRANVESMGFADSFPFRLTVSIGITRFEGPGDNYQTLIKRADSALYASKREGRNCVRVA
jgi:diguanylate cyclase (GGDEF)-like protein/PAS domain S-box-containing protein